MLVRQHFTDTFYGFNADYHAKTTQPYDDAYFFVYDYLAENDEPTWVGKCDVMPPLRQQVTMSVRGVTAHRMPQYVDMVGHYEYTSPAAFTIMTAVCTTTTRCRARLRTVVRLWLAVSVGEPGCARALAVHHRRAELHTARPRLQPVRDLAVDKLR